MIPHHPLAVNLFYEDQKKEAWRRAADFLKNRMLPFNNEGIFRCYRELDAGRR